MTIYGAKAEFVANELAAPISDHEDNRRYFLRDGALAVLEGLILVAIIMPWRPCEDIADEIMDIARIADKQKRKEHERIKSVSLLRGRLYRKPPLRLRRTP